MERSTTGHPVGEQGKTTPDDSDAALLAGGGAGFGAFVDRHLPAILSFLVRRVGHRAGEELSAEVFAIAYTARSRWSPARGTDARPWLYGIATNLVRRHRSAETRFLRALPRHAEVGPGWDDVDARVAASMARHDLAGALARLRTQERDVLLLHAWADLTYEQIADALDLPVGTVRSRLHRARTKLRAHLSHLDPEGNDHG